MFDTSSGLYQECEDFFFCRNFFTHLPRLLCSQPHLFYFSKHITPHESGFYYNYNFPPLLTILIMGLSFLGNCGVCHPLMAIFSACYDTLAALKMLGIFRYVLRNLIVFLTESNIYKFLIATIPRWLDLLQKKKTYTIFNQSPGTIHEAIGKGLVVFPFPACSNFSRCETVPCMKPLMTWLIIITLWIEQLHIAHGYLRVIAINLDVYIPSVLIRLEFLPGISCRLTCNQPVFCDIKFNFSFPTLYAWCPRDNFKSIMFSF